MEKVITSGSLIPSTLDTPLDKRERVTTFEEIANIENPARFMTIVVEDTVRHYEVRKLASKVIGGIVVENARIDIDDPEALYDLTAVEEARENAEKERDESEIARKRNEDTRIENEIARGKNENQRQTSEEERGSNEGTRKSNENVRTQNETQRISSENERVLNENNRKTEYSTLKTELEQQIENAKNYDSRKADVDGQYDKLTAGFSQNLIGRGEATPEEFTFRPSGGLSIQDGTARVKRLKGNTVVWNQLINSINNPTSKTENGVTFTKNDDGSFSVVTDNVGATADTYIQIGGVISVIKGHKYILYGAAKGGSDGTYNAYVTNGFASALYDYGAGTFGISTGGNSFAGIMVKSGQVISSPIRFAMKFIDLTKMFVEGNEPSTVEEFRALFPDDYYDYNPGELKSLTATAIKSVGFNAWDEEWELGNINTSTGNNESGESTIRTKNYIPILPNTTYYLKIEGWGNESNVRTRFYDINKNYIGYTSVDGNPVIKNRTFVTPLNAYYMRFDFPATYGTTYNHDICINISHSGYRDGEYHPYEEFTRKLPIQEIKDSDGNLLFPDGLCSAGEVYDEITEKKAIKRIGKVDLGTLSWNVGFGGFYTRSIKIAYRTSLSDLPNLLTHAYTTTKTYAGINICITTFLAENGYNGGVLIKDSSYTDVNSFKAAISGVMLYYELKEPIEVDLDPEVNMDYEVWDFGTEQMISDGFSTPIKADIVYGFNSVDRIRNNTTNIEDLLTRVAQLEIELTSLKNEQDTEVVE